MLKLVLRHRIKIALAVLVMAAGVLGVIYWGVPFSLRDADHAKDVTLAWLEEANPVFLLLAIAVLPLAGFPISPLLVMGGVVYGETVGMLVGAGGVALNNVLGYWVAAWLREPVRGWLERRGVNVPEVSRGDGYKIVLLLRVTPGLPATVQNYVLGLSGIPFWTFFWVSLPPQLVIVAGFVLTAGALFEGQWGLIILGVSLLLVFGIVGRLIHSHRKNTSAAHAAEPDQPQR
jgi:uncharacterized membrane protein YdjX (TVP38/TMEM64 family)